MREHCRRGIERRVFPVLSFALGPVLLGVAHVASDLRYLVVRRNLARWWRNAVWASCAVLVTLRALEELCVLPRSSRLEYVIAAAFIGVALMAAVQERGSRKRAAIAGAALTLTTFAAWQHPGMARYVFLHAHNVIALVAWGAMFRDRKRWLIAPVLLIAAITTALAGGALARQTLASPFATSFHLPVSTVAQWVAPFTEPRLAIGVATAYLFLQSLHYSVWLNLIPQEEQAGRGTLTFRMSLRSLFADLGALGVAAVGIAAAAVILGAGFGVLRSQALYLSLATFHGYLELALLAYFWVRGGNRNAVHVS